MPTDIIRSVRCVALLTACAGLAFGQTTGPGGTAPQPLREVLHDAHAFGADHWIYSDFNQAVAEARKSNRPIFVTFRCVPGKACAGFDAEVAKGSEFVSE